jgi:hypothetical protein
MTVQATYAALTEHYTHAELCHAYGLTEDATAAMIAAQAILWGDANNDGSLN